MASCDSTRRLSFPHTQTNMDHPHLRVHRPEIRSWDTSSRCFRHRCFTNHLRCTRSILNLLLLSSLRSFHSKAIDRARTPSLNVLIHISALLPFQRRCTRQDTSSSTNNRMLACPLQAQQMSTAGCRCHPLSTKPFIMTVKAGHSFRERALLKAFTNHHRHRRRRTILPHPPLHKVVRRRRLGLHHQLSRVSCPWLHRQGHKF